MVKRLIDGLYRGLQILLTLLMGLLILPVCMQILSRFTEFVPRYIWTEEVARLAFIWTIMLGSMIAVRDGTRLAADVYRPAAFDQPETFGRELSILVHADRSTPASAKTPRAAVADASRERDRLVLMHTSVPPQHDHPTIPDAPAPHDCLTPPPLPHLPGPVIRSRTGFPHAARADPQYSRAKVSEIRTTLRFS